MPEPGNSDNGESSASLKLPFGTLRVTGTIVLLVLLEIACTGLIFWYLLQHDASAEVRSNENTRSVTMHLREQNDLLEANLFMLSLSPEDRAKYRLDLPRALRDRVTGSR